VSKRIRKLWHEFEDIINSNPAWLAAFGEVCLAAIESAIEADLLVVAATEFLVCSAKLLVEFALLNRNKVVKELVTEFQAVLHRGGNPMACATTHKTSTTTQGPGVCCAAFSASGLAPAVGVRVAAVNKLGKCIICEIKASTSKKSPGTLVFKRGKAQVPGSTVSCPTSQEGCCALTGA
jgi:hypothetical protein